MKKRNICGIFATVFAIATVITLASCSQDDEYYYDSEMFTRSEEMMTRGGDQGGYTPTPCPIQKIAAGADTSYYKKLFPVILELVISWPEGYTTVTANPVNPSLGVYFQDEMYVNLDSGLYYEIKETTAQWNGGSAVYGTFTYEAKTLRTNTVIRESTIHFIETVNKVFLPEDDEVAVDSL